MGACGDGLLVTFGDDQDEGDEGDQSDLIARIVVMILDPFVYTM